MQSHCCPANSAECYNPSSESVKLEAVSAGPIGAMGAMAPQTATIASSRDIESSLPTQSIRHELGNQIRKPDAREKQAV